MFRGAIPPKIGFFFAGVNKTTIKNTVYEISKAGGGGVPKGPLEKKLRIPQLAERLFIFEFSYCIYIIHDTCMKSC